AFLAHRDEVAARSVASATVRANMVHRDFDSICRCLSAPETSAAIPFDDHSPPAAPRLTGQGTRRHDINVGIRFYRALQAFPLTQPVRHPTASSSNTNKRPAALLQPIAVV